MNIIRAWKDPEYRMRHSGDMESHPSGLVELPETELANVGGGATELAVTFGCCGGFFGDTGWICIPTANGYETYGCLV